MNDHAINNARAWAEIIAECFEAIRILEEREADTATADGQTFDHADDVRDHLQEMPLSVQVRDGWRAPGAKSDGPEEFEILLSTGGPALRVYGEIGGCHALQWQDWGTPWTDYHDTTDEQDEALSDFVGLFYLED